MRYIKNRRQPLSIRRLQRKTRQRLIITIVIIIFLSYFVFTWFLPTLIGGLSVLNRLKPKAEAPVNISEGVVLAPPVFDIPFEATNTAKIQVRGYINLSLQVEIYLDDELITTADAGTDGNFEVTLPLTLGTNNLYGRTVNNKGEKSLPSKKIKIIYTNEKPVINLQSPSDNQQITGGDKKIQINGTVAPIDGISLDINGNQIIVNGDGPFSKTLDINEGDNNLTITASDQAGNITTVYRKVIYTP